jgi:hypothetical protein
MYNPTTEDRTWLKAMFISHPEIIEQWDALPNSWLVSLYSNELAWGLQWEAIEAVRAQFTQALKCRSDDIQGLAQWSVSRYQKMRPNSQELNYLPRTTRRLHVVNITITKVREQLLAKIGSYPGRWHQWGNGYGVDIVIGQWYSLALQALSLRDTIGLPDSNFTQENYDIATCAWRKFMGEIHSEDTPLTSAFWERFSKMAGKKNIFILNTFDQVVAV